MGITGLLPFLSKASEKVHLSSLANSTVAIDSYCWLHKGAFAVADKLARGEDTDVHIDYCMKFVNLLLSNRIKPILVFDGQHLPAKADTEAKRREERQSSRQRAAELMRQGNYNEARKYQQRCVDITHEMALKLIKKCREINVDCIVAPYEADAQLAFLSKIGLADYVVTEDSDLVLFGCRKILFKLDIFGACDLVDTDKLHLAMNCPIERFTMDKFRLMCILSGCDYIDSLPGIGLKKAQKFVMATEETDLMRALDKIPAYLNMRQLDVTEEYKVNVLKARATFLHMVVFDPRKRKQVRLNDIEDFGTDIEYCSNAGEILDDHKKALDLAVGNLNPFGFKKLDNWHPNQAKLSTTMNKKGVKVCKHPSIWTRNYLWTTTLNGATTSTAPKAAAVNKSPKPQKRIVEKLMEIEDDDDTKLPTESENNDLLLNQYINLNGPSSKRFKDDIEIDEQSCEAQESDQNDVICRQSTSKQITPNRNPFKKSESRNDELLSPTEISKENNSLVKTQSPVKRFNYSRLEKCTKFGKRGATVVPKEQRVVSRFFPGNQKDAEVSTVVKSDSGIQEDLGTKNDDNVKTAEPNVQMKSPSLLGTSLTAPSAALYFTKSIESPLKPEKRSEYISTANNVDDGVYGESLRINLKQFEYALKERIEDIEHDSRGLPNSQGASDKTDDSETNVLPIVLSDGEDGDSGMSCSGNVAGKESSNSNWLASSQKYKSSTKTKKATAQRKKSTTSNNKSSTKTSSDATQRRLTSMFGFEKKPQIQL